MAAPKPAKASTRASGPTADGSVGGLYEACVGVNDLAEAIDFFAAFGCRAGTTGEISAQQAQCLYGVNSALRSVRLQHQSADHGLLRLMQWDQPRNDGVGLADNLRCIGSRWGVRLTANSYNIVNHVERARQAGMAVNMIAPQLVVIDEVSGRLTSRPFRDPIVGVREMVLLTQYSRQVLFERFGYESPLYGQIDMQSLLRTSQHTHCGLMIADDDPAILDFYEELLGLKRTFDDMTPYENTSGSRAIFGLEPGEGFHMVDFDDPRTGMTLAERRSGKLKCVRFAAGAKIADCRDRSRAGSLGYSLYTWRVANLLSIWKRAASCGGTAISDICCDEFGAQSFTLNAPDGYQCLLLQA